MTSDDNTKASTAESFRREFTTIFLVLAVPAALTVWSRLSDYLQLNRLADLLTRYWRHVTRELWKDLFELLNLRITAVEADMFTFSALVLGTQIARFYLQSRDSGQTPSGKLAETLNILSATIIFTVIFFPLVHTFAYKIAGDPNAGEYAVWSAANILSLSHLVTALILLPPIFLLVMTKRAKVSSARVSFLLAFVLSFTLLAYYLIALDSSDGGLRAPAMMVVALACLFAALCIGLLFDSFALTRVLFVCGAIWIAGEVVELIGPIAAYLEDLAARAPI